MTYFIFSELWVHSVVFLLCLNDIIALYFPFSVSSTFHQWSLSLLKSGCILATLLLLWYNRMTKATYKSLFVTYSFRELEYITKITGIMARRRHDAETICRHIYLITWAKDRKPWMLRNLESLSQWHTVFSKFILLASLQNVSPTQYQLLKYMSVLRTFSCKRQQDVCLI